MRGQGLSLQGQGLDLQGQGFKFGASLRTRTNITGLCPISSTSGKKSLKNPTSGSKVSP